MADRQTLKTLFADDPEMVRLIESREKDEEAQKSKNDHSTAELLNVFENRNQTELLREIAANKKLMKGEKGDTPEKGKDYFTPSEVEAIMKFVKEHVKEEVRPIKGKDYFDGEPGRDGIDGKDGRHGLDGRNGKDGKNGKDGESFTIAEARQAFESFIEDLEAGDFGALTQKDVEVILKKHVTASHNKLAQDLATLRGDVMRNYGGHGGSGGGSQINFSTNETLTNSGDNQNFTFAKAPTNVLAVWTSETGQSITDYTFSGVTLTLTAAMPGFTIKATSTN